MVAASASFGHPPFGYQTNLMVYGPGGYKFSDFMRVGIPLNLLYGLITVLITPLRLSFLISVIPRLCRPKLAYATQLADYSLY